MTRTPHADSLVGTCVNDEGGRGCSRTIVVVAATTSVPVFVGSGISLLMLTNMTESVQIEIGVGDVTKSRGVSCLNIFPLE